MRVLYSFPAMAVGLALSCSGCSLMKSRAPEPMFTAANAPRALPPRPQPLGYTPTGLDPNRHVDFMPGVPLHPVAYAVTMPVGSVGNVFSTNASYFVPRVALPQTLQFYRKAMAVNGWQKHPEAELYRKGVAQMALYLRETSTGTLVEYVSGRQMVHDGSWASAFMRAERNGGI